MIRYNQEFLGVADISPAKSLDLGSHFVFDLSLLA